MNGFRVAMERGLGGRSSSLAMLPSRLSPRLRTKTNKRVIAIDAGGTNLRAARINFDGNGRAKAEERRNMPMPGTNGPLTADEFFAALAGFCEPLFDGGGIDGVGFCFSYPMEIKPDGDGIPLSFCKEVELDDLTGRAIGKGFRDALVRRKIRTPERIVMLNDTTSALLCGLLRIPPRPPSKIAALGQDSPQAVSVPDGDTIGMILGTGFNIAYCEKSIPKIGFESEADPQVVVCEAGNFDFGRQGTLDREFDSTTKDPGRHTTEKAVSGAYLGSFSLVILKHAVKDGVLRFKKSPELLDMDNLTTKDLNTFLQEPLAAVGPLGRLFGTDETGAIRTLVYLESIVTERAALIASSTLAAVTGRYESARDPLAPARIAVEGSTFSVHHFLAEALRARLHGLLNTDGPRFCIVQPVEQASLFGAAVAALT
jgi:hexokinase